MNRSSVAAVVLAAGSSSRFRAAGGLQATKLLAPFQGEPMVRTVVRHALATRAHPVIVVTGHHSVDVEQALAGLPVTFVYNPDFADGLSTSLKSGIAALPDTCTAAAILLGDMPLIEPVLIEALIGGFEASGADAAVPVCDGQRGNPVILSRRLFGALKALRGDRGAGLLLRRDELNVCEIPAGRSVLLDVDTPEALA